MPRLDWSKVRQLIGDLVATLVLLVTFVIVAVAAAGMVNHGFK